jgi:hypothetical protein
MPNAQLTIGMDMTGKQNSLSTLLSICLRINDIQCVKFGVVNFRLAAGDPGGEPCCHFGGPLPYGALL